MPSKKKSTKSPDELPSPTYQIHIRALAGVRLLPSDPDGRNDPYVVFGLLDAPSEVRSAAAENSLYPKWDQVLDPIDGYYPGNDVLTITIFNKDLTPDGDDDKPTAAFQFPVSEIPFGVTTYKFVRLFKVNEKGKVSKKEKEGEPGGGGGVKLVISIVKPGDPPFVDNAWTWPLLTARVTFVGATGLGPEGSTPDPYVVAKIQPSLASQKTKTKKAKNTVDPVWNQTRVFFVNSQADDVLELVLYDHDSGGSDDLIGTVSLPLKDLPIGEAQENSYPVTPSDKFLPGTLSLIITLKEKSPPDAWECKWVWKSYPSTYSTSFTGYTNYPRSLSDLPETEDALHFHDDVLAQDGKIESLVLAGRLIAGRDLGQEDGDPDTYVVITVVTKAHKIVRTTQTTTIVTSSNPPYDHRFDFGSVKRGQTVEFTVFRDGKGSPDVPIGFAGKQIKAIELGSTDVVEVPLVKGKKDGELTGGALDVVFELNEGQNAHVAAGAGPAPDPPADPPVAPVVEEPQEGAPDA